MKTIRTLFKAITAILGIFIDIVTIFSVEVKVEKKKSQIKANHKLALLQAKYATQIAEDQSSQTVKE